MRSVNSFAYSLHKVGGKQTETAGDSGWFLCNCPSVGLSLSRAPIPALLALLCNSTLEWSQGEGNSVVRNRAAQTIPGMASEQWRGRHYWHLWRQSIQNSLELWLGPGPLQLLPWPTLNTCSSPSCSSSLILGGRGPCWEREMAYILEQSQLSPTLMTSVLATWDLALPPAGWCWPLSRGETLALDLVLQSSGHVLPRW